jgi:hypothetical protein
MRGPRNFGLERFGALDGSVEVVDLEPQSDAVPIRSRRRVADPAVVMLELEAVELQQKRPVANQTLRPSSAGDIAYPRSPAAARPAFQLS